MKNQYLLHCNPNMKNNTLNWNSPNWLSSDIAEIRYYHPRSTSHHPRTQIKLQYNDKGIYLLFRVHDQYVLSRHTEYNAKVNEDSCVEWFIRPESSEGYYNFEFNAGGTLHVNYIIDPVRDERGDRKDVRAIPEDIASQIEIKSSLPGIVEPEIREKTIWLLAVHIPLGFFSLFTPIKKLRNSVWRGNLYKCGDKTSQPHWGSWAAIGELNFHQPESFGEFIFRE